ncbi:MAG TPA: glycosyltransferase [Bacteroidota bacterium]|nr:glycosyltransferase [Bacteroidota bacterium]
MKVQEASVDVLMITYNHEAFIAEAIESVICQKTNFPVRLIIGDDHSSDATFEIASACADRFPGRIIVSRGETNIGMNQNWAKTYACCQSKYVALLEGDDYWSCDDKLQKQVDFMESHADCVLCFHDAVSLAPDGTAAEYIPWSIFSRKASYTDADFVKFNLFPTCSALFRNGIVTELPPEFYDSVSGDWLLYVLLSQHGPVHFLPEKMGVRRVHNGGVWSGKSPAEQYLFRIRSIEAVDSVVGGKYREITEAEVERLLEELANCLFRA